MCNSKNPTTMKKKYFLKQHYQPECLYKKKTYKELIPFYEIGIGVPGAPEEKKAELGHKKFVRLCKLLKNLFAARNMWHKFAFRSKLQANRTRMCVYLATFNGILKVFRRRVSNIRVKMLNIMHRVKEVQNQKQDIADTLATQLVQLSIAQTAADAPASSSVPRARDHESDGDRSTFQEIELPAPAVLSERVNEDLDSIIPYEEYEKILRIEADEIQTERTPEQIIQDRTDDRFVPYRVPVHGAEVPSDDEPQINIVVQAEVHEIPVAYRERTQLSPGVVTPQDIASTSLAIEAFRIDDYQGPRFEEQAISVPVETEPISIDDHVQASAAVPDRESDDINAIIPFDAYEEMLRKESEIQSERIAAEREQRVQTPVPFVPYRPRVHGREDSSDEEPEINIVVRAEVHEIPAAHRERTQSSPGVTPQDIAPTSLAIEAFRIDDQGPAQLEEQATSVPVGTVPALIDDHVQVSAAVPDRESDDINAIIPYDAFEELLRKESETQSKRTAAEREQQVQTPAVPFVPYRPRVHGRKEDSSDEEPQINITVQAEVHEIPAAHRDPAELSQVAPPKPPTDIPQILVTDADPSPGQQPIVSPEPQPAPTDQPVLPANVFVDFAVPRIPKRRKPRAKKRSGSVTPEQEAPPKKKRLVSSYTWYRMKTLEKRFNRGDRTKFKLSPVAKLRWSLPERDRYRCDENLLSLHSIMVMYQTRDVDAEEGSRIHRKRIKALVTARYSEEAPPPPKVSAPRWSRRTRHAIRKEDVVECDEEEIIDLLRDTRHAELDEYKQWLVLKEDLLESRARGASLAQAGRKSSILGALAQNIRQFQRTPKKQLYLELLHDHVRVGRPGDPEVPLETIQAVVLGAPLATETEKVERSAPIVATPEEFLVPAPLVAESQVPGTAVIDQPIELPVERTAAEPRVPATAALDQPIEFPVEPTVIEPPTARASEDIAGAAAQVATVADPPRAEPRDGAPAVTGEVRSEEVQQDGIIIGGRVIPRELPVESRAEITKEAAAKSVTPEAVDEEPARLPPRPEGVTREDIEEKLRRFRDANVAVVTFSDMCPPATTKKADAVRTMMFLTSMHKKGIVMDVDPNVELARDAILIRL